MSTSSGTPHQCPRCELRFLTVSELGHHLTDEHHIAITLGDPTAPHAHLRHPEG